METACSHWTCQCPVPFQVSLVVNMHIVQCRSFELDVSPVRDFAHHSSLVRMSLVSLDWVSVVSVFVEEAV